MLGTVDTKVLCSPGSNPTWGSTPGDEEKAGKLTSSAWREDRSTSQQRPDPQVQLA